MSWQTEMVTILRSVVGDITTPYEFNDTSLQQLIVSSGQLMIQEVDFSKSYTFDHTTPDITPDPTDATRDEAFVNLVVLKAACLLGQGEWRRKSRQGFVVKDDVSSIDGRTASTDTKAWAEDLCDKYARAVLEYKMGNSKPGTSIIGPHNADFTHTTSAVNPHRGREFFS
jgi:hypothetical protein